MSDRTPSRDPYFDNLKGILIYLVFAGHCLGLYRGENPYCAFLFQLIYAFHMPLFLYLSGYFSKNLQKSAAQAYEALLVPAIPFELLYFLLHWALQMDNRTPFLTPIFAYWYLFVLFGYRVLMPYMARLRWMLPLSTVLSLCVGFNSQIGEYMTLSRFFCLLPFFLLGYYTDGATMEKLRRVPAALAWLLGVVGITLLFLVWRSGLISLDFTLANSYEDFTGLFGRAFQGLLAVTFSLPLLRFTPKGASFLTRVGQRTLQIYLLNFYGMTAIQMVNPFAAYPPLNAALMLLLPALMTALLSTPLIDVPYQWLIKHTTALLVKKPVE